MTFSQLEYALALYKHRSYRCAAQSVGISQPALSIQIRKLEEDLGLTLFDRTQKKVDITPEGKVFLERAQVLLTETKQLKNLAFQLSEEFTGKLKIGIIPTVAPYLLPLFLHKLNEQFPKLKMYVREAVTEEIVHGIKSGDLDAGIIATPIKTKIQFSIHPLFYEPFSLFISQKHPLFHKEIIELNDIPLDDLWLLKEGNCLRNQVDDICNIQVRKKDSPPLFYFESNSIESLCRIVEYKGGITVLPELTTLYFDGEREAMIKKLAGPRRVREISLLHLPNHTRAETLEKIGTLIKECIPKQFLDKGKMAPVHTNVQV